jgi:hypothetical protein
MLSALVPLVDTQALLCAGPAKRILVDAPFSSLTRKRYAAPHFRAATPAFTPLSQPR